MFKREVQRSHYSSPQKHNRFNKMDTCLIAFLALIFLSATAFGQGASASLTGTIQDASGGAVPGAAIVVRNVDTGVEAKTTSNDRGSYTFPSLQVGTYELVADASGFSRATRSVRLAVGATGRLDVTLAVAGTVTEVEVTGAVESVILEAGSSTGTVMQEDILTAVPLLSGNVMDLVTLMGGVSPAGGVFDADYQTFAGVSSRQINITRDGLSINEGRFSTGITASMNINPEMVGEFKMVLSPVDAEMGRGAGQVQMTTRSGSNAFHGSATWNVQNTALDAADFSRKLSNTPLNWRNLNDYLLTASGPVIKNKTFFFVNWEQQLSRGKSVVTTRVLTPCARKGIYRYISDPRPQIGGWIPGAASENNVFTPPPTSYTRPSVDMQGNILLGGSFYNNQTNEAMDEPMGRLEFESVFGPLNPSIRAILADPGNPHGASGDCGDLNFNGMTGQYGVTGPWDTRNWSLGAGGGRAYRHQYDPTGFVDRFTNGVEGIVNMPPVNVYNTGDGLNYAGHRWVRSDIGPGGTIYGTGADLERKSVTVKLDHNINSNHRLSGTVSVERFASVDAEARWPEAYGGYGGSISRKPMSYQVSLTSTLRPTLLNEFRAGLSRSESYTYGPIDGVNKEKIIEVMQALMPTGSGSMFAGTVTQDVNLLLGAGEGALLFHTDSQAGSNGNQSHPFGSRGNVPMSWGGNEPRWVFSDTMTWMKGSHSFKWGVEYRKQSSMQSYNGSQGMSPTMGSYVQHPSIYGGAPTGVQDRRRGMLGRYAPGGANDNGVSWRGLAASSQDNGVTNAAGNYTTPYQMMSYFAGSLNETRQYFYAVPDASRPYGSRWNDVTLGEDIYAYTIKQQELHMFFKDDWKVTRDLTLNLGIRHEYYGVPFAKDGRSIGMVGGSKGVWGISQPGLDTWMNNREYIKTAPGVVPDPVTRFHYVGPGSPNPDIMVWHRDMNNFAPHLGFAWQLPWLGKGKTTLRGGWSVSYAVINNWDQYGSQIADLGGAVPSLVGRYYGDGNSNTFGDHAYYMDITDLPGILPLQGDHFNVEPMKPHPVGGFFGDGLYNNANVHDDDIRNPYVHSLNMSLTRNIGRSLTVDLRYVGTLSRSQREQINVNSINYISNGLNKELEIVRRGGESAVINSIIPYNEATGTRYLANIANATGSEQMRNTGSTTASALAVANFNSVAATLGMRNGYLTPSYTNELGLLSRAGCLPEDRPGYLNAFASDPKTNVHNFPCQYGTPWNYFYSNPQHATTAWSINQSMTNYHSMQAQVTMRPTRGLNFQATYTWSRNLTNANSTGGGGGWSNLLGERDYVLSSQHRSHTLATYGGYELPFGANGYLFRDASGFLKKAIEGWQLSWVTNMISGTPRSVTGASTMWSNSYPVLVRPDLWNDKVGHASEVWDNGRFVGGNYFGSNMYVKVLDRGICNPDMMTGALYNQYCERNVSGVPNLQGPRALALSSGERDANRNLLPLRYNSLEEARKYDPAAQMDVVGFNANGSPVYDLPPVIVFRNANQTDHNGGQYIGNYAAGRVTGTGRITFDMALSKSIEFMEGKRFELRIDAQNILNHPTASGAAPGSSAGGRNMSISDPGFVVNSTAVFGNLPNKGGHRTFQARLALRF